MNSTGTHGLVAATADEPGGANYTWDSTNAPGSAQYACANKVVTVAGVTYSGWIVPSMAQMTALYANRYAINPSDPNGGFSVQTIANNSAIYWTSTASATPGLAWTELFTNGFMQDKDTTTAFSVRCIRTF